MATHNLYHGYIKLGKKKAYQQAIRLDFNAHIESGPGGAKFGNFSLRLLVLKKIVSGRSKEEHPEMGVTLRPEDWLDLIEAMKEEFESASKARRKFDDMS